MVDQLSRAAKVIYSFKGKRAADALQIFLMGATNVRHYLDPALSYVPQFFHRAMMQTMEKCLKPGFYMHIALM